MKKWILRIVVTAMVLSWMWIIFGYSAQQGEESAGLSTKVSLVAVETTNKVFHMGWNQETVKENAKNIEYPVRKCAHMTEYAILSMLVFWMYGCYGMKISRKRYLLSIAYVFCYASTDEYHQTFVPDRSGRFSDVCIDTIGACLAMLFLWLIISLVRKHKNR